MNKRGKERAGVFFAGLFLAAALTVITPTTGVAGVFDTQFAEKPEHLMLVIIDGLSHQALDRLTLPVLSRMAAEGTFVERNYLPPAAHPRTGAYAELHTCSIPNPIMMAGTVFITPQTRYLQDCFPNKVTAFAVNATDYRTLNVGYTYSYQKNGTDLESTRMALTFMEMGRPAFMRFHLQWAGEAGARVLFARNNEPWKWNLWAADSPYRAAVQQADSLVAVLLEGLRKQGMLEKTAVIVMGDHGENDFGWHSLEYLDGSSTSIILYGAGVKKGVRVPYSEQIDVVSTVCALMGVEPPKTSQGRPIVEAISRFTGEIPPRKTLMKEMDESFVEYRQKVTEAAWRIENLQPGGRQALLYSSLGSIRQSYYDINRFVEWPRFATMEELLANNKSVMARLDALLADVRTAK